MDVKFAKTIDWSGRIGEVPLFLRHSFGQGVGEKGITT
jgi:hypothetical protein